MHLPMHMHPEPLSGPSLQDSAEADSQHYRAFIAQLENKGADLSHVKVGKSVMVSFRLFITLSQLSLA